MTETETSEYLARRRQAVRELKAALAAGENEADAAHRLGFATRNDLARQINAVRQARNEE